MKNKRFITLVTFSVLAFLVASSVSAFVLLSPRRTWNSPPTIVVDNRGLSSVADGDGGRRRTRNAIRSNAGWNGSGAGRVVWARTGSVANYRLGDGIPMLNFRDPIGVCSGSCLAATFTGYFTRRSNGTYRIFDADMVTNTAYNWASRGETCSGNEFYVEAVMVHEVGHLLGLAHTPVGNATMFASTGPCNDSPRTTASDDEAAIRNLY
ncbi:MAG: matrixin family metalloprotease [Acidobacteriota bacterium]